MAHISQEKVEALQESVRRARLNRKVKILSPFWAKKLEARNAANKLKKILKKDNDVQQLPNLKELTRPVPNRSTQRAMHQYRKSNCFRTVPRDVPQREYFQTELFYNMQQHWLKGPTVSSLPRKLRIPNGNGLTETDAAKKYYFKHNKWVDDSKQYHHIRSSLPPFGSNQIRKSPFDVPVEVPPDVRPSASTRRRDRRAARKAKEKKPDPPPLNDSTFRSRTQRELFHIMQTPEPGHEVGRKVADGKGRSAVWHTRVGRTTTIVGKPKPRVISDSTVDYSDHHAPSWSSPGGVIDTTIAKSAFPEHIIPRRHYHSEPYNKSHTQWVDTSSRTEPRTGIQLHYAFGSYEDRFTDTSKIKNGAEEFEEGYHAANAPMKNEWVDTHNDHRPSSVFSSKVWRDTFKCGKTKLSALTLERAGLLDSHNCR